MAVVIGAMVIAPMLGPNIGFALGAALDDWRLIKRAVAAGIVGIALAFIATAIVGYAVTLNLDTNELLARTQVGLDAALALAAGAAAALAVTTRSSSSLVGVMVAAALLPPTCAVGLFLGAGRFAEAQAPRHYSR